jgi:hypothetical protein
MLLGGRNAVRDSRLTHTGAPLELAFVSHSGALRYTVEPGSHPGQALRHALALMTRLGCALPDEDLLRRLSDWQQAGALRFGAHIGGRHDDGGDSYKLYAEIPIEAAADAEARGIAMLGRPPVLTDPDRAARPVLVGINPATGDHEIYYRVENLHPAEIGTLMQRIGLNDRAAEVRAIVAATQRIPPRHAMPGRTWGFSYAVTAEREPIFSLYSFARTLFGPDGRIRDGVLALAQRFGWDLGAYAELSAPLRDSRSFTGRHGLFGIVVAPGSPPGAWIGLAPPTPEA